MTRTRLSGRSPISIVSFLSWGCNDQAEAGIRSLQSLSGSDGIRTGAPAFCFDAFSSREPVSTSLENALTFIVPSQRLGPQTTPVMPGFEAVIHAFLQVAG